MFQLSGQTNQKHANIEFIIRFPFLTNNGILQLEFYSFASFRIHGSQVMQLFNGYTSDALSGSKMVRKPSSQTSEEASKKCIILCLVPFPRFRVKREKIERYYSPYNSCDECFCTLSQWISRQHSSCRKLCDFFSSAFYTSPLFPAKKALDEKLAFLLIKHHCMCVKLKSQFCSFLHSSISRHILKIYARIFCFSRSSRQVHPHF